MSLKEQPATGCHKLGSKISETKLSFAIRGHPGLVRSQRSSRLERPPPLSPRRVPKRRRQVKPTSFDQPHGRAHGTPGSSSEYQEYFAVARASRTVGGRLAGASSTKTGLPRGDVWGSFPLPGTSFGGPRVSTASLEARVVSQRSMTAVQRRARGGNRTTARRGPSIARPPGECRSTPVARPVVSRLALFVADNFVGSAHRET
jgi:hypothetical protein